MKETIVVIGANHGGTAVLNTILDQFPGNRVLAFDRNSDISFLGCGMALWIGGQISGPEGLDVYKRQGYVGASGAAFPFGNSPVADVHGIGQGLLGHSFFCSQGINQISYFAAIHVSSPPCLS